MSDVWTRTLLEVKYLRESSRQREPEKEAMRVRAVCMCAALHFICPYLFISLQLLNEGSLIEESMQAFLGVVVA